jgi:hypothetical protein
MIDILSVTKFFPIKQRGVEAPRVQSRTTLRDYSAGARAKVVHRPRVGATRLLVFVGYGLILGNVLMLATHVIQANRYAVKGYQITRLRNGIANLQEENKKLSLRLSENTSIVGVQQIMTEQRFVPVTVTEFIKPSSQVSIK